MNHKKEAFFNNVCFTTVRKYQGLYAYFYFENQLLQIHLSNKVDNMKKVQLNLCIDNWEFLGRNLFSVLIFDQRHLL